MFYLLSIASTLVSLAAVVTGIVEITPAQQRYFDSLGPVDYLGNLLILLISAWAVVEFFLMRKAAVRAFVIAPGHERRADRVSSDGDQLEGGGRVDRGWPPSS